MLVRNAQHVSLTEAMAKTFDGAHPCALCHAVAAGKKSEQKSPAFPTAAKLDLICLTRPVLLAPPAIPHIYPRLLFSLVERPAAPPVPPPRHLLA